MKIADIIAELRKKTKKKRGMPDFNFSVVWWFGGRHFSIFSKLPSNNSSASVKAIKPLKNVTKFSLFYESSCQGSWNGKVVGWTLSLETGDMQSKVLIGDKWLEFQAKWLTLPRNPELFVTCFRLISAPSLDVNEELHIKS